MHPVQRIGAEPRLQLPYPEFWSALLLVSAISFNAFLALVNAKAMQLGRAHVVLAELAIVGAALALILLHYRRQMTPWMLLCGALIALGFVLALGNQSLSPKFIRDVLLLPVFVMLGMLFVRGNILKLLAIIQIVIVLFMVLEGVAPQFFSDLFGVMSYYINTRDMTADSFWNTESTLFVSAQRIGERFLLPMLDVHRLSSIFLEPVSLGNYCIVATICICTFWRRMNFQYRLFFIATTAMILVGADGRLALVSCLVLVPLTLLVPYLPRYTNVLYLPASVVASVFVVWLLDLSPGGDDFAGRLANSMRMLGSLDFAAIMGVDAVRAGRLMDSGVSYIVATQSVIGTALLWTALSLGLSQRTLEAKIFAHGAGLYIALNLLVSYSFFSIKTAALLYFVYGFLRAAQLSMASVWRVEGATYSAPETLNGGALTNHSRR